MMRSLPGNGLRPRPIICHSRPKLFVGRARMIALAGGQSQPSANTPKIAEHLHFAAAKARQCCFALLERRLAVDMLAGDSGAHELVADVHTVTDAAGVNYGLAVLAVLEPCGYDVGDELRLIHALRELTDDVNRQA